MAHEHEHDQQPANYDAPAHHDVTRAEADAVKSGTILLLVVVTVATLIVVVLGIVQFFDVSARDEIDQKMNGQPNSALRDLRALEKERLSRYVWVDQAAGKVRIPVERALELTLRDWEKRPSGIVEVNDNPPAPAPGAAPAAPATPAAPGAAPAAPAPGAAPATPAPAAPAPAATPPAASPQPAEGTPK